MNFLVIRPASIEDIQSIVAVRLGAVTEDEISEFGIPEENLYSSIEKLKKKWDIENRLKDGFEVFVAEDNGEVIGFIVFTMKGNDNIDNIVVAKKQQGKGVGRALVEYVEKLAITRDFDVLGTDTTENVNGVPWRAYGFWRRMGYVDTGERIATEFGFKVIPLVKKLK